MQLIHFSTEFSHFISLLVVRVVAVIVVLTVVVVSVLMSLAMILLNYPRSISGLK